MRIGLFSEDEGHRALLESLTSRIAAEEGVEAILEVRNAQGGLGRAIKALKQYGIDLASGIDSYLEVLIVAIDGNCRGTSTRKAQIRDALGSRYPGSLVLAVPDPHVELWYLADRHAVAHVLDQNYAADVPRQKCERGRYKTALRDAFSRGGVDPVAGGIEFGGDIGQTMDLREACRNDAALNSFVGELRASLRTGVQGSRSLGSGAR
jgi:hypothetical protein